MGVLLKQDSNLSFYLEPKETTCCIVVLRSVLELHY